AVEVNQHGLRCNVLEGGELAVAGRDIKERGCMGAEVGEIRLLGHAVLPGQLHLPGQRLTQLPEFHGVLVVDANEIPPDLLAVVARQVCQLLVEGLIKARVLWVLAEQVEEQGCPRSSQRQQQYGSWFCHEGALLLGDTGMSSDNTAHVP